MKNPNLIIVTLVSSSLLLAACQGQGPKQTGGTIIGAAAGGLLGSKFGKGKGRFISTGIGVLAGSLLGAEVGKSLDNADKAAMRYNSQKALENIKSGQTSEWSNPDSGNNGSITPKKTYQTASGQYCREYQQTVTVGGKTAEAYGTACRQPDGSWMLKN